MRILFTSFPGLGHLHPLMSLALAARDAGHDVRTASGPDLVGWTRRAGVDAYPVGPTEAGAAQLADRDFSGPRRTAHMFTDVWVPAAVSDLIHLTDDWVPDLVVHEEEEYAGVLLAAILGVACVTQSWAAPARPAAQRELALELLAPIWRRYLSDASPRRLGQLYLDSCPQPFQTAEVGGIAAETEIVTVGPSTFDGVSPHVPDLLATVARPAVYLTLGTVAVFSRATWLREIALALAPVFATVIVTTGPNAVGTLGPLPPNVYPLSYVAQSVVLPAVDVMVSHGGAGGATGALLHGRPHLVLPGFGQSQIAIGAATQRIGSGLCLPPSIAALTRSPAPPTDCVPTRPSHGSPAASETSCAYGLPRPASSPCWSSDSAEAVVTRRATAPTFTCGDRVSRETSAVGRVASRL